LAEAIPALVDEYACAFPNEFQESDLSWHESTESGVTRSYLLWKQFPMIQLHIQLPPLPLHCSCMMNYPNARH
jgi:hypothetical protein